MKLPIVVSLLAFLVFAEAPQAAVSPASRCEGEKLRVVSRSTFEMLACHARAASSGATVEESCLDGGRTRLVEGFAKAASRGGCASTDDTIPVGDAVDALVQEFASSLDLSVGVDRCAAGKLRAAAKRIATEILCRRRASRNGGVVEPGCLAVASENLATSFARFESRGVCNTSSDDPAVETKADEFVEFVAASIAGTAPAGKPTGLAATLDVADIELSWVNADPGSGRTHAKLLRRLNSAPSGPDDGAATELLFAATTTSTDDLRSLLPDTGTEPRTYHYAVYGCTPEGDCEGEGSHTTFTPTLTQALVAGGYVLHWRHASATVCSDRTDLGTAETTMVPDWWKSCDENCGTATARQLNPTGRAESIAIGDAFRARGIPVGRVLTSEFCRNVETAALMNFGPTLEEDQGITYFVYDEPGRCAASFALLAEVPTAGTNTAIIGHSGNTCPPLSSLAWAEAAVYRPDGVGGSVFVARVPVGDWMTLP